MKWKDTEQDSKPMMITMIRVNYSDFNDYYGESGVDLLL